jgi:hypothetical protein
MDRGSRKRQRAPQRSATATATATAAGVLASAAASTSDSFSVAQDVGDDDSAPGGPTQVSSPHMKQPKRDPPNGDSGSQEDSATDVPDDEDMGTEDDIVVCGSLRARRQEVVSLVAQLLGDLNLPQTLAALTAEARLAPDSRREAMETITEYVQSGSWTSAVDFIAAVGRGTGMLCEVVVSWAVRFSISWFSADHVTERQRELPRKDVLTSQLEVLRQQFFETVHGGDGGSWSAMLLLRQEITPRVQELVAMHTAADSNGLAPTAASSERTSAPWHIADDGRDPSYWRVRRCPFQHDVCVELVTNNLFTTCPCAAAGIDWRASNAHRRR